MKNYKKILMIFILFLTYFLISLFSYSNAVSSSLSENVFRLHVIANSDSREEINVNKEEINNEI